MPTQTPHVDQEELNDQERRDKDVPFPSWLAWLLNAIGRILVGI